MKIYTYNTGEKAVFINDEKIIIDDNKALLIELFYSKIEDIHNESAYKCMREEDVFELLDNYEAEQVTRDIENKGTTNSLVMNVLRKKGDSTIIKLDIYSDGKLVDRGGCGEFYNEDYQAIKNIK